MDTLKCCVEVFRNDERINEYTLTIRFELSETSYVVRRELEIVISILSDKGSFFQVGWFT